MRQVKAIASVLALVIFRRADISYEIQDEANHTETDMLYLQLDKLLRDGHINEAENMLFQALNLKDTNYLLLAADFYQKLNDHSDEALETQDFSREEVRDGFAKIVDMYGIKLGDYI